MEFFATAAKGTEPALRDELRELRLGPVRADRGGVHFSGEWTAGFRACLASAIALRVMHPLATFDARGAEALYEGARGVDWSPFLDRRLTLAVSASCRSSELTHTQFIAQKTKDAIVDQLRDRSGARPSVDRDDPDVHVFVHLVKDRATVYLDLAGESLHRRGYRKRAGDAPLKETLAAAIVRMSGWDRKAPLLDPMCGSGTIPVEAALWAYRIAPGLARPRFGFERWASHDESARRTMRELREEARAAIRKEGPTIRGSDVDPDAIAIAIENARAAGVRLRFDVVSVRDLATLDPPGFLVTNPPYGERLEIGRSLDELGAALRRMHRSHATVLAGSPAVAHAIPMRAHEARVVWNGDIECRLLSYDVR